MVLMMLLSSQNQDKVKIDLYYETLCQYSEALYINELARVERDLSDYIELETYPSGFSKVRFNQRTFKY